MVGGHIPHHSLPNYNVFSAVRKWLEYKKPDILHIHTNYAFTSSVLLGCRGITPVVQTVHDFRLVCPTGRGISPDGHPCGGYLSEDCVDNRCISNRRYLFKVVIRRVQRALLKQAVYQFIAPSMALHRSLEKDGLPSVHIPYYSDTSCDSSNPADMEKNLVLFIGYLHFSKGVDLLIRAFREVLEEIPSARLFIAGNGPVEDELRSLHQTLNLGEAVKFLGEVSGEEIPRLYRRSSFVVIPSIVCENSPLIIYEAMTFGRAVLGSRIGGIPELVEDGKTGLLFECNNRSDLASKMVSLLKNEALLEQMGEAGRRRAETEFTVEKYLQAILGLYDSARQTMK